MNVWGWYLHHHGAVDVDGAVVHHLHDGHSQVAADAEGDAEAQATEDAYDVPLGDPATAAVQQGGFMGRGSHGAPVLVQLNVVFVNVGAV